MTETQTQQEFISSDDKLLSLVSHLSACLGGILVPIIIYFIQKDKSKYVAYNALSAILWQLIYILIILILSFGFIFIGVLIPTLSVATKSAEAPVVFIIFVISICAVIIGLVIFFLGYAIWAAIKSYQGELIKYPFIGNFAYKNVYGKNI
ncbi:MAG TPA: DUF4870 domain-containing protein [Ignavibacteria bacterium]|nr:DUF4870 domain-containing protein [Ignavibacteria bacterium]